MTGKVIVQEPANYVVTMVVSTQERFDLEAFFYRLKNSSARSSRSGRLIGSLTKATASTSKIARCSARTRRRR